MDIRGFIKDENTRHIDQIKRDCALYIFGFRKCSFDRRVYLKANSGLAFVEHLCRVMCKKEMTGGTNHILICRAQKESEKGSNWVL